MRGLTKLKTLPAHPHPSRPHALVFASDLALLAKDFHWEILDLTKRQRPNALVAKALGGCGIHNAMLYVRGLESDFAKWDVEGFDYASAVETWKKHENYTGPEPLPEWHGRGGPISTTPPAFIDEVRGTI